MEIYFSDIKKYLECRTKYKIIIIDTHNFSFQFSTVYFFFLISRSCFTRVILKYSKFE